MYEYIKQYARIVRSYIFCDYSTLHTAQALTNKYNNKQTPRMLGIKGTVGLLNGYGTLLRYHDKTATEHVEVNNHHLFIYLSNEPKTFGCYNIHKVTVSLDCSSDGVPIHFN